jgi:CubicO group peptidase (beta-lactamase class C family)
MKKLLALALLMASTTGARAQDVDVARKLEGFDDYMAKVLKDWNGPGIGVGIVVADKLVFAKGYGYRDYEKKLPFTPGTVCPIASNTKLFTAVAAGMLVEEGKLNWDKPVRESVPTIRFNNEQLNNTVTLRDMLSHRTGITRHDTIWYKSDFTRKELFDRLKYLEPQEPMRQAFLYNNLMFAGVGYMIELQSGKTWEQFVRDRILQPLEMRSTGYTIAEMVKQPEHGVGFTEKRDSFDLYRIPYYEDIEGVAPCGAIVSNIEDLSPLGDRPDERREVSWKASAALRCAEADVAAGDRLAQHGGGAAGLLGGFERGVWHGPSDGYLPGAPHHAPRR